jgi:hypothetical protein
VDTLERLTVTLQSDCICTNEDETNSDECFGCWDDSLYDFDELISAWRERAGIDADLVRIEGRGMTWQSLSGHAITNLDTLYKALTINGDFRIELQLEGETLTARRYSHDEPMGCSFTFAPYEREDEDED